MEVPVAFQNRYQFGQERREPFGTDEVGGRPGDLERILYR